MCQLHHFNCDRSEISGLAIRLMQLVSGEMMVIGNYMIIGDSDGRRKKNKEETGQLTGVSLR